ncbi:hypothetical protein NLG97_g4326 [Lecanicillium saksenae]|uniref:Uncharacterized protein n=1 Tax=Lecanicillium saksenae TaxID=468837 RepID=A0ACC1QXB6_9HYPO|nr:hypothetical protein NLG97_g4326 [Lecanicillium saksenae]
MTDLADMKLEVDEHCSALSGSSSATPPALTPDLCDIHSEVDDHVASNDTLGGNNVQAFWAVDPDVDRPTASNDALDAKAEDFWELDDVSGPTASNTALDVKTEDFWDLDPDIDGLAVSNDTLNCSDVITQGFWELDADIDDHDSALSGDTLTCSDVMTPDPWDELNLESLNTLFHAVLAGDADEVYALSSAGMYIPPLDSWIIFEACLQGPQMIKAFCSNPWLDPGQPLAGLSGSAVINHLLQTAATRFLHGKTATISALLEQAISPIAHDRFGNHALHILAESSETEAYDIMKLFLCRSEAVSDITRAACTAHVNSRNRPKAGSHLGNTPLTLAVLHNNIKCASLLLANGADPTFTGEFNQTPLDLAVIRGHCEIVRLLLDYSWL